MAFALHKKLAPRLDTWARTRIASGRAAELSTEDISGTEWPPFGAVFYLWSTEALQAAWEKDHGRSNPAPKDYARPAIDSLTNLVIDPNHAAWVKKHWGEDYLRRENLFYRTLVMAALTAHYRLTGSEEHLPALRKQVEGLSAEIDASPHGLVDDYPGECYPCDVMAAIACIRRADPVLGTDHSAFAARAYRAFQGNSVDELGLPPYAAEDRTGECLGTSRGCATSFLCSFAPELWPEAAAQWYAQYEQHFWQYRWGTYGFREFAKDANRPDWYADVDSGPTVAGHGFAACAFGVGAARANGRFDHAYPLTAEFFELSWPLPNGRLALPALLSNATDAPLSEAGILYNLTRTPWPGFPQVSGGHLPALVYVMLAAYVGAAALVLFAAYRTLQTRRDAGVPLARLQFAVWCGLLVSGTGLILWGSAYTGLLPILLAQLLPRTKMRPWRENFENKAHTMRTIAPRTPFHFDVPNNRKETTT